MLIRFILASLALGALVAVSAFAQSTTRPVESSAPAAPAKPDAKETPRDLKPSPKLSENYDYTIEQAISRGVEHLLAVQEGNDKAEWPYEGVYRVGGQIPIGYRIGGTGICAMTLLQAPGYDGDAARQQAVARAAKFVIEGAGDPLMSSDYDGGYDVRGWGYTYGLAFLLRLKSVNAVPPEIAEQVEATIKLYIDAIQRTEINTVGGWNYARQRGKEAVSPPSPFMTAPTLQALFEARQQGYEINAEVVDRGLQTLEKGRSANGAIVYAGAASPGGNEQTPGAVGRMLATETTLHLAGRSSLANVRGAVDAFIVHWEWLDKRRAQQGTHLPPYGIAPYYFYYAHYYAAQAVELLPSRERAEYRRRINDLLASVRLPDGTWNDRVFERSSNYGTAMAMMAIMMPDAPEPAKWK